MLLPPSSPLLAFLLRHQVCLYAHLCQCQGVVDTLLTYLMVELLFPVTHYSIIISRMHDYSPPLPYSYLQQILFCFAVVSFRCCILVPLLYYSVVTHVYILTCTLLVIIQFDLKGLGCGWLRECALVKVRARIFTSYTVILRW